MPTDGVLGLPKAEGQETLMCCLLPMVDADGLCRVFLLGSSNKGGGYVQNA